MKTQLLFATLFALATLAALFAQGPLPPPGAPAPTMKSLDQIESRTPVTSLPFTINQSGSYYLTGNLQLNLASGAAITIAVNDVTLDLMGFTLSSSSVALGDAIRINGGLRNIAVSNGVIAGNTTVAISGTAPNQTWTVASAGFSNGINGFLFPEARSCHFSHLRISGCRSGGLKGGGQAIVEQVTATQNGNTGIALTAGSSVTHCTASLNAGDGISASTGSTGISGNFLAIANSSASGNGANGLSSSSGTVTNCTAFSNGDDGISASNGSVANCAANSNGSTGISASSGTVTNCTAIGNGSDGISTSGVVAFSQASGNSSVNIDAFGATRTGNHPTP